MTYEELKLKYEDLLKESKASKISIEELEEKIFKLEMQVENLTRNRFGRKKEDYTKTQYHNAVQLSFFDLESSKKENEEIIENVEKITVSDNKKKNKSKSSKKPKSGLKKSAMKKAIQEIKEYISDENETCHVCNSKLVHVGKNAPRTEIVYVPAHFKIINHVTHTYKCSCCGTSKSENDKNVFKTTKAPATLFNHSFASPSLCAEVMYKKFLMGVPFYRQELVFDELGMVLPRNMMANWVIKANEYYLSALVNLMLKKIKQECEVLHCDETTIQCNKEVGRAASSKSYMWSVCSGEKESLKFVVFKYSATRSESFAKELLKGYSKNLITDGYAGYNNIEGVVRAGCWSHLRRYFFESIPNTETKDTSLSLGSIGVEYCDKLFEIEREIANLSDDKILQIRQNKSQKVFNEFYDWVETSSNKYSINTKLKKALTYAKNQKTILSEFIKCEKIPMSNNRAERTIRPFAIHRKNWLFADSVEGAKANATMYSIIETAKLNNLNVYKYLNYLLEELPQKDNLTEEVLEKYLPCSTTLPKEIQNYDEEYEEIKLEEEK